MGVARVVVLVNSILSAVLALTLLMASTETLSVDESVTGGTGATGALVVLGGLLAGAVAALGFWARSALGRHDRSARMLVTIAAGIDLVVVILAASSGETVLVFLGALYLHAAVVAVLWLPTDARRWFDEAPLPAVEQFRRQVVAGVAGLAERAAAASSSVGHPTPPPPAPRAPSSGPVRAPHAPSPRRTMVPSDLTVPIRIPAPTPGFVETTPSGRHRRRDAGCVRCGGEMQPSFAHCPRCGTPRSATPELQS